MVKGLSIKFQASDGSLKGLLYSFSALYIKQHTKGVVSIRTGTLKQVKGLFKGLK
jgi:hypothetical protein